MINQVIDSLSGNENIITGPDEPFEKQAASLERFALFVCGVQLFSGTN